MRVWDAMLRTLLMCDRNKIKILQIQQFIIFPSNKLIDNGIKQVTNFQTEVKSVQTRSPTRYICARTLYTVKKKQSVYVQVIFMRNFYVF